MHADWQTLYRDHLQVLQARADAALDRASLDHLVVPSGTLHYQVFDDRDYRYAVNPQFTSWVQLTRTPRSWLVHTRCSRPNLAYMQPRDYCNVTSEARLFGQGSVSSCIYAC